MFATILNTPISQLISGNYHGLFLLQDDPGPCLAAADVVQVTHDGPGHQKSPGRSRHSAILSGEQTFCHLTKFINVGEETLKNY